MRLLETLGLIKHRVAAGLAVFAGLREDVGHGRAEVTIEHRDASGKLLHREKKWNLITNAGRDFLHQQGYQTSGLGANGLNFIALSDDTLTETATSSDHVRRRLRAIGALRATGDHGRREPRAVTPAGAISAP